MINKENIYRKVCSNDDVICTTNNGEDFLEAVRQIEEMTTRKEIGLDQVNIEVSEHGYKLNGIPMRDLAVSNLCDRLGVAGHLLDRLSKEELVNLLRFASSKHSPKEIGLMVNVGPSVAAVLSGDYRVLHADKLFEAAEEKLVQMKGVFSSGLVTRDGFSAVYRLLDDKIAKIYRDRFNDMSLKHAVPVVTISTSNTGFAAASILPQLKLESTVFAVGKPLRVVHKGGADLDGFKENLDQIYAMFRESAENLERLRKVNIENPVECFYNVAKRVLIPKKYAVQAGNYLLISGATTALDIYLALTEVTWVADQCGASGAEINDLQEMVARAIFLDYIKYDIPYTDWKVN